MILSDQEIANLAKMGNGMISPFCYEKVKRLEYNDDGKGSGDAITKINALSYGLNSYGYDLRLSPNEFRIFRHLPGTVVDPKNFDPSNLESTQLYDDETGSYFILPAHSYGLGVSVERLELPRNITAIAMGKSTYARCGIVANVTPIDAGFVGYLTLELSNSSSADCKIYADEGIVQLLFFRGQQCNHSYRDVGGKYQGQINEVTLAK